MRLLSLYDSVSRSLEVLLWPVCGGDISHIIKHGNGAPCPQLSAQPAGKLPFQSPNEGPKSWKVKELTQDHLGSDGTGPHVLAFSELLLILTTLYRF